MNFYAHHGCYEEEKIVGTHFKVDLEICYDSQTAETTDNIKDAVNYLNLYQIVNLEMMHPSNLLENIAKRILDAISKKFPEITSSCIKITKLAPPLGGDIKSVTVEIEKIF